VIGTPSTIGMIYFWDLQDTLEDLADASGTEFEIPAGFDEQVYVTTHWFVTIPDWLILLNFMIRTGWYWWFQHENILVVI